MKHYNDFVKFADRNFFVCLFSGKEYSKCMALKSEKETFSRKQEITLDWVDLTYISSRNHI